MSTSPFDRQTLRQEFCKFLAFETVARLKYANPPAFLPGWRGHGEGPTKNSKSAWYAFRAELLEVVQCNAHIVLSLYPEISDPSECPDMLGRLASALWKNCKNIARIQADVSERWSSALVQASNEEFAVNKDKTPPPPEELPWQRCIPGYLLGKRAQIRTTGVNETRRPVAPFSETVPTKRSAPVGASRTRRVANCDEKAIEGREPLAGDGVRLKDPVSDEDSSGTSTSGSPMSRGISPGSRSQSDNGLQPEPSQSVQNDGCAIPMQGQNVGDSYQHSGHAQGVNLRDLDETGTVNRAKDRTLRGAFARTGISSLTTHTVPHPRGTATPSQLPRSCLRTSSRHHKADREAAEEAGSSKKVISRPPGQLVRSNRRGYTLFEALNWSEADYQNVRESVDELCATHLDENKTYSKQAREKLDIRTPASQIPTGT
ncbi:hypothetical protein AURDEDRAFT_129705 [Auricularia subglabra TFB-10046 SS5]|nr:hypothetical protein AURDEDRAFT_129705 [Auricularia subglabra TFB-10046 SS5]